MELEELERNPYYDVLSKWAPEIAGNIQLWTRYQKLRATYAGGGSSRR